MAPRSASWRLVLGLAALAAPIPASGQTPARPSIDFEALLQPPSRAEIREVAAQIAARDYLPDSAEIIMVRPAILDGRPYEARFIRHRVNGALHCGLAFVPQGAAPRSLAALVDVPGVRWDFPARNLSEIMLSRTVLGPHFRNFVIIAPCLRGSAIEALGIRIEAEGDRRDAYDGAAHDTVAFTHAATALIPEIDPERVVLFGASRGGAVAVLAAERSAIFKAVVSFFGPMDHFREMNRPGGSWATRLREAYEVDGGGEPGTPARQQLEMFVEGREAFPIRRLRARILAMSPLYFVERLPPTQIHLGTVDAPVPLGNALRMREAFERVFPGSPDHQVHLYEGAGHDLSGTEAAERARTFLWAAAAPENTVRGQ